MLRQVQLQGDLLGGQPTEMKEAKALPLARRQVFDRRLKILMQVSHGRLPAGVC